MCGSGGGRAPTGERRTARREGEGEEGEGVVDRGSGWTAQSVSPSHSRPIGSAITGGTREASHMASWWDTGR